MYCVIAQINTIGHPQWHHLSSIWNSPILICLGAQWQLFTVRRGNYVSEKRDQRGSIMKKYSYNSSCSILISVVESTQPSDLFCILWFRDFLVQLNTRMSKCEIESIHWDAGEGIELICIQKRHFSFVPFSVQRNPFLPSLVTNETQLHFGIWIDSFHLNLLSYRGDVYILADKCLSPVNISIQPMTYS